MFYIHTEKETCKRRAASASISPMNHLRLGVTNTDYSVWGWTRIADWFFGSCCWQIANAVDELTWSRFMA